MTAIYYLKTVRDKQDKRSRQLFFSDNQHGEKEERKKKEITNSSKWLYNLTGKLKNKTATIPRISLETKKKMGSSDAPGCFFLVSRFSWPGDVCAPLNEREEEKRKTVLHIYNEIICFVCALYRAEQRGRYVHTLGQIKRTTTTERTAFPFVKKIKK